MGDITRFHVRDGFVLDEHPAGSVVRYDHHCELVAELEEKIEDLKRAIRVWEQSAVKAITERGTNNEP